MKVILSKLVKADIYEDCYKVELKLVKLLIQKVLFLRQIQVTKGILGEVSGETGSGLFGDDILTYHCHF